MKLFTIGPVQMYPETLKIEGSQLPYFRTEEFGKMMKECERFFLDSVNAPDGAAFAALTSSGTGAMDAAVVNTLTEDDKALVINGGSFGKRFAEICRHYGIPTETYDIPFLKAFSKDDLERYQNEGYTALLVNACDTSTGQKYDLEYLHEFCIKNDMLFIVDAVSAYLADPIDMTSQGIDVLITASQKALALSPGVSLIALSEKALKRVREKSGRSGGDSSKCTSYYFDLISYIENQKRGQPPFTSAVGTMLALHQRLESIMRCGIDKETELHRVRAEYFRKAVAELPVEIPNIPLSNSCTPLIFPKKNATAVYEALKDKHDIFLTPSGGDWKDVQLRVGHLGNLSLYDYDILIKLLEEELG